MALHAFMEVSNSGSLILGQPFIDPFSAPKQLKSHLKPNKTQCPKKMRPSVLKTCHLMYACRLFPPSAPLPHTR